MKLQLIEQLEKLLETEAVLTIKQQVKQIKTEYKVAIEQSQQKQLEAWNLLEHAEGEDFKYVPENEDMVFDALIKGFEERLSEQYKKQEEEQQKNLKGKQDLLNEIKGVVEKEQNIGKAFQTYQALTEKWKKIGDIPSEQYQKINTQYLRLKDAFFYNINIYKELKEYDLKVNLKRKEELILKAKSLQANNTIKEVEVLVKQLQKEWTELGPSPQETYKEIGDEFFSIVKATYDRVQKHYDELKKESEKNLLEKKKLIDEINTITNLEIKQEAEWIKKSNQVIALQEKWKTIGFTDKQSNEKIWKEFRKLCDLFFEKKAAFYALKNGEYKLNKEKKEELIKQAEALQISEDWKVTTTAFLQMQKQWQAIGSASRKDEHKLWLQFRSACDVFFNNKKEHFKKQDSALEENLKVRQQIILEVEQFQLSENVTESLEALKLITERWNASGNVSIKNETEINKSFSNAINKKFGSLGEHAQANEKLSYQQKIEVLKNAPNGGRLLEKEGAQLRKKLDGLKKEIMQYENNITFFKNSSIAEQLKSEVEQKVAAAKEEMKEISKQLQLIS